MPVTMVDIRIIIQRFRKFGDRLILITATDILDAY